MAFILEFKILSFLDKKLSPNVRTVYGLGKFERIPDIIFLEKLNIRNNFYIESHHPLRETIINQTGRSHKDRISFLQNFYINSKNKIPSKIGWKPKFFSEKESL